MAVKFEHNQDGSVIVMLQAPIRVRGEEHDRLTIPALKGKHLKSAPFVGSDMAIGQLVDWANKIVEPAGAVDELSVTDAMKVATEVATSLSKSS